MRLGPFFLQPVLFPKNQPLFGEGFGPILEPKSIKNPSKIDKNLSWKVFFSRPSFLLSFSNILGVFFMFSSFVVFEKVLYDLYFTVFPAYPAFDVDLRLENLSQHFLDDFHPFWAPFLTPQISKIGFGSPSKTRTILGTIFGIFG